MLFGFKSGNEFDYFLVIDLGLFFGDLGLVGGKGYFFSIYVYMFIIICICILL